MNVTEPVGVPVLPPSALTVAVNVTDWPKAEGLALDVTIVADADDPTVTVNCCVVDVLAGVSVAVNVMMEVPLPTAEKLSVAVAPPL